MKNTIIALAAVASWTFSVRATPGTSGSTAATTTPVCGSKGWDSGTDSFWDSSNTDLASCVSACGKQSKCKSYAFGKGECYLYNVAVAGNLDSDSTSPYAFYDVACTSTASATPATSTKKSTTTSTTSTKKASTSATVSNLPTTSITTQITTKQTTLLTTTTTTTKPSSSSSSPTCPIDTQGCTQSTPITACNPTCGCTYIESCGGGFRSTNGTLADFTNISYSACLAACDARQPDCVGVTYMPYGPLPGLYKCSPYRGNGTCYLYGFNVGTGQNPSGWLASRMGCERACFRV